MRLPYYQSWLDWQGPGEMPRPREIPERTWHRWKAEWRTQEWEVKVQDWQRSHPIPLHAANAI